MEHEGYAVGSRAEQVARWDQWSKNLPMDGLAAALKGNDAGLRAIVGEMTPEEAHRVALAAAALAGVAARRACSGQAKHVPAEAIATVRKYSYRKPNKETIKVHNPDDEQMELF